MPEEPAAPKNLTLRIGDEEIVIRKRYEAASIANDVLIALWFIVGSVMFFSEAWAVPATWCFLLGSIELLIRPVIRLSRHVHLQRIGSSRPGATPESAQDY